MTAAPLTLALFGATGFTGRAVLDEALRRGHTVRALVRDPTKLEPREGLTLVKGNALDAADVERVLEGTDAVIHCLGVGGKGNGKRTTLVSDSIALVLEALRDRPSERLVCMSNVGVQGSGAWWVQRLVIPVFLRWLLPIIEDKERMEAALRASQSDWVAVRLPNIVEGPPGPVRSTVDGKGLAFSITTDSVAVHLLDQVVVPSISDRTPSVSQA